MNIILVLAASIVDLYNVRKEVIVALIDAGYTLYLSYPDKDERAKYFESIGCKYVDIPFERRGMNPVDDFKLMKNYIKVIKKIKPIAVLTYTIKPNIYGGMAAAWCGVPQIANVTGLGDSLENPGVLRLLAIALYKMGLRKSRTVFFQNSTNQEFCLKHGIVRVEQIKRIPGSGVNTSYHIYQEYPNEGTIKFLFIARLLKDKGTDEYLEAARVLKAKCPNAEFQILGHIEGNYNSQVEELAKADIINYLGATSDVRPFIGKVHCTVLPSYHEGLSNVNLESAANGRPVITTNVSGCRETIDDGVTGLLCEPRSAESLIDALDRFIRIPHELKVMMGRKGREKVDREFNREIVVKAYIEEIKKLVKT